MQRNIDVHKAAGILLKDRKLLITRQEGKNFFVAPGGRVEAGEAIMDALKRELMEELQVEVEEADIQKFGTFYAAAKGDEEKYLQMDVFTVQRWKGEIVPSAEVEEVRWIDSVLPADLELGSIFQHDVLPKLKSLNLID